ncbi:tRNA (N6-isopentenyl adenosine(37)-C2)-methylthiotransferase MiaB [Desulfobacca acetoxidans]|uniref:tRNA-2-methylthio-N(6)-dimethylallyladenosine synthase n=1 Tax=Desulfobacca acetoxidans (strain ATCC 700848 / DSM 11109 / ASRB2) TaxID=880072 RepID=F2NGW1_DESAR|nr:tRNA (N6-isopentenyl adenosine(37)-C2)-methylthiotransferase MiaB [Desulfobacca acetoxidans]AEB08732.1 (Dimethylallyl)adenosine tRNA methylthiotransferase miaB [Desulfobacca acetoxidans DSM 11109]
MNRPKKNLYIKTYGCQMNVYDSEQIALILGRDYDLTDRPEEADLYLINTCSIRRKSEEKVLSLVGRLKGLKNRRPQMLLGVGGCVAQQEGERLLQRAPHLDLVFGAQGIYRLPHLLHQRLESGKAVVDTSFSADLPYISGQVKPGAPKKLVTIMQGCNNYCTYCVVPYVRGPERSRPAAEVINEVQDFLRQGGQEVTLLGQNVNSYGKGLADGLSFPGLLRRLAKLPGLVRLRFTTSHPRDLSDDLICCFAELPPLCDHIHLPVQAGSNHILARMHRGYTREEYLHKVNRLRQICPGISLTTDLIVGFPGETEADFADTLALMREVAFDAAFYFKYSPRPQTAAAALVDQIPEPVKAERLARLRILQEELSLASNQRLVGQFKEVLVEGLSKQQNQQLCGRLRSNQVVNFDGPQDLIGRMVWVRIEKANLHSLGGHRCQP